MWWEDVGSALSLSSWDKRGPVRIQLGSSTDPTMGARADSAFPNIHTTTLQEVPDLDHVVATLQDVSPAPTRDHAIPKGSTASPTPCPAPPGQGYLVQTPPAPSFTPLQPNSSAGIIITLLQRSRAAFWAPSAKPVEGCDPPVLPHLGPVPCEWGARDPLPWFLASPLAQPSSPGLWGRSGSGVGSGGSPRQAVGQHCGCSGRAGSRSRGMEQVPAVLPQRVSPSPSAEAMTPSIQAA